MPRSGIWELFVTADTSVYIIRIAACPQRQHCLKIVELSQSLPLQMAESLLSAQPDSVANHITVRSISDRRALT